MRTKKHKALLKKQPLTPAIASKLVNKTIVAQLSSIDRPMCMTIEDVVSHRAHHSSLGQKKRFTIKARIHDTKIVLHEWNGIFRYGFFYSPVYIIN